MNEKEPFSATMKTLHRKAKGKEEAKAKGKEEATPEVLVGSGLLTVNQGVPSIVAGAGAYALLTAVFPIVGIPLGLLALGWALVKGPELETKYLPTHGNEEKE